MQVNLYNLLERLKEWILDLFKSRAFILILVFCALSGVLVHRVFVLQIVKGQDYLDDYKLQIQKTKEIQGTRGRIYDRNGVVLADNKLAYSVTIEDNGDYSSSEEKNEIINNTIMKVIEIVESHDDSIVSDFKVVVNEHGNYEFNTNSDTQRLRFLADIFGYATIDKLSLQEQTYTAEMLIDYLCGEKIFGIDQSVYSKEDVLKMVNIRYAMYLNRFQKYVTATVAYDVSEETTAAIMENQDVLQGINIEEDSIRYYPNSKYFANILGYTGKISQEEYDALETDVKNKYSLTDIVGKAGLEQVMDQSLQGEKGEIKLYVNSVGKVIETVENKEAKAGNDVYLTIDAKLQKVAYDLLEEKLAGILLERMANIYNYDRTTATDGSDVIIPIDDVYFAFFDNEIIDVGDFEDSNAKSTEKRVHNKFLDRKEDVLKDIQKVLKDVDSTVYEDCSKETRAYLYYIVSNLLTSNTKVLVSDKIDYEDDTYLAWTNDGSINVNEYLNYALSKNWIDTSKLKDYLGESSGYSDMNETYNGLVDFIASRLATDGEFDKLVYKYMIKSQRIRGSEIGMILMEQKIVSYNESNYNRLSNGDLSPYIYIRSLISNLEITPGQLGLEPCTGSVVATDPRTGEVLACVSYPGYNNNKLANTMDASYYSYLINHTSAPLYNNATQERTAPGSTYKPLVSIAGLTEGVINSGSGIYCNGIWDTLAPSTPGTKCLSSHGTLDVASAIRRSCNEFFCEIGYRLGITAANLYDTDSDSAIRSFSNTRALETLGEYATLFGLNEKSGLEVPESAPQISDQDAPRSSIGQGTNNYTISQLARYTTAMANRGTVYSLTLLDKTMTVDGKLIEDYSPEVLSEITSVNDYSWTIVHAGMRAIVANSNIFDPLKGFKLAGKSGTAQQSKSHANHALFIGFAPMDNPELSFAIRIKNGYTSQYTSEIARDLTRYHFGLAKRSELIHGKAKSAVATGGFND